MLPTPSYLQSFEESNRPKKKTIERWLLNNVDEAHHKYQRPICFLFNTSFFLTVLPDSRRWQPDFRTGVLTTITDRDMQEDLTKSGLINWCPNVKRLIPVKVPMDGNCLLHAVATAVWGISDKTLMLRNMLSLTLSVDPGHRFHSRWFQLRQRQIMQLLDKVLESGAELMEKEWKEIRQCLEPDRSYSVAVPHRFLESIHVYALANILRRPIIVLTDPTARTFSGLSLQENDMGGIYLPLEWSWTDTCRTPILLGYFHSHFSPLLFADPPAKVGSAAPKKDLAPLVTRRLEQFPVRFLLPGEEPEVAQLLRKYLRVRETVMQVGDRVENILCAQFERSSLPAELNIITDYFQDCATRFQQGTLSEPAKQFHHSSVLEPQVGSVRQERLQMSASSQSHAMSQKARREVRQKTHAPEYGLGDPVIGGLQHQLLIPPPSVVPVRSFEEQNVSMNPTPDKKCVVPTCKFYGDPDLAMMCSRCFTSYTIKESRQLAAGQTHRLPSSAALDSMPGNPMLSLMDAQCKESCGFYCSVKTYPYCHECANRIQRLNQEKSLTAALGSASPSLAASSVKSNHAQTQTMMSGNEKSSEIVESTPLNDLNGAPSQPSASHLPLSTEEHAMSNVGVAQSKNTQTLSSEELTEAITRVLVTGDMSGLPSDTEDPKIKLLFSSGQPSSPSSSHAGHLPLSSGIQTQIKTPPVLSAPGMTQLHTELETGGAAHKREESPTSSLNSSQDQQQQASLQEQELSSAAALTKSGTTSGPSDNKLGEGNTCASPNCNEPAMHRALCGKCYVSQGMSSLEPASLTAQENQATSSHSSSSSAPASVNPDDEHVPKSSAIFTKEGTFVLPTSTPQPPTNVTDLTATPSQANMQIHNWLVDNRMIDTPVGQGAVPPPGPTPPAQGLPDKEESEPLGSDLIASGLECYSSTQRCIGCGGAVPQAGKLCQQCQDILQQARHDKARQGPAAAARDREEPAAAATGEQEGSTSVKGTVKPLNQTSCRTEGCTFFGVAQNLGYCTRCYKKHVLREVESGSILASAAGSVQSFMSNPNAPRSIRVPADFIHVHTPRELQGEYCNSAGCTMFGDPSQANMCLKHYQQHLASISRATRTVPVSQRRNEVITIPYASEVRVLPNGAVICTSGNVQWEIGETSAAGASPSSIAQAPQLSVPPPSVSSASNAPRHSLGETYYRVAGYPKGRCVNPTCTNYGSVSNGGLCNSCAQNEQVTHDLISRGIYGDEETG